MKGRPLEPSPLRIARITRNLTQRQLADLLGINIKTVAKVELGGKAISKSTQRLVDMWAFQNLSPK